MKELLLTPYQKVQLENTIVTKQEADKVQEEILAMIFAFNKIDRPKTKVEYREGKLFWEELPTITEPIEG